MNYKRIGMRLAASLVQFKLRSTTSVTGIANVNEMLAIEFSRSHNIQWLTRTKCAAVKTYVLLWCRFAWNWLAGDGFFSSSSFEHIDILMWILSNVRKKFIKISFLSANFVQSAILKDETSFDKVTNSFWRQCPQIGRIFDVFIWKSVNMLIK